MTFFNVRWMWGCIFCVFAYFAALFFGYAGSRSEHLSLSYIESVRINESLRVSSLNFESPEAKRHEAMHIWFNNVRLLGIMVAGGATLGVASILQLIFNAVKLGLLFGANRDNLAFCASAVAPHWVLEYTAFIACAGRAMEAVFLLGNYLREKTINITGYFVNVGVTAAAAALVLVLAAYVEVYITPGIVVRLFHLS